MKIECQFGNSECSEILESLFNSYDQLLICLLCSLFFYTINWKIWALQDGTSVVVGGKTNRAKAEFPDEMNRLLDQLPELVESSLPK